MKRIIFFLTLCLMFASCEKGNNEPAQQEQPSEYRIAGQLSIQVGPASFVNTDTMVVTVDDKQQLLTIEMLQMKFSDKMPVGLDVYAENLPYQKSGKLILVNQASVILTWGPEHAAYTDCPLTDFRDTLDIPNRQMRFNCTFSHARLGDMPARFEGSFIQ